MATKSKKSLITIFSTIVILGLIVLAIMSELSKKTVVNIAVSEEKTITSYIEERARTSLPHIYHITMPLQGNLLPILVEEGDLVTTGDVVAKIDDIDWQDNKTQIENIVIAVEKWVLAIESQVKASKIREDFTKWEWDMNKDLMASSFISEKEGRNSKRWYLDSTVKIEEGQAMFHMSQAFQEIVDLMPAYVKRNLDKTTIKTPVTGKVLKRHVWNQKVMNAGEPLLDIGNMDELEITADVLTEEAVSVNIGDRVEIFGETVGRKTIEGTVRLIEPEAFTKTSSLGVEEQRVAIKIGFTKNGLKSLENSKRNLGLHYRVRVRIITDEQTNKIVIPRTALFHGIDGSWQLYRIIGNEAKLTMVKVGLLNNYEAEIISGLKVNERVIIAPESAIKDGLKVVSSE